METTSHVGALTATPTVGRIVYYKSRGSADGVFPPTDFASIITKVYSDDVVSLVTFSESGFRFEVKCERGEGVGQWDWMPFQKKSASNSQSAEPRPLDNK